MSLLLSPPPRAQLDLAGGFQWKMAPITATHSDGPKGFEGDLDDDDDYEVGGGRSQYCILHTLIQIYVRNILNLSYPIKHSSLTSFSHLHI